MMKKLKYTKIVCKIKTNSERKFNEWLLHVNEKVIEN